MDCRRRAKVIIGSQLPWPCAGTEHLLNSGAALQLAINARQLPVAESLSYNVVMDRKGCRAFFCIRFLVANRVNLN